MGRGAHSIERWRQKLETFQPGLRIVPTKPASDLELRPEHESDNLLMIVGLVTSDAEFDFAAAHNPKNRRQRGLLE